MYFVDLWRWGRIHCLHPILVLRFRVLGSSFSSFGCFVFEIWVLRVSVFVFECFVFETTGELLRYLVENFLLRTFPLNKCLWSLQIEMRSLTSTSSHCSTFKGPSDISEHTYGEWEAVERSTAGTVTAKYKDESFLSTHEHEWKRRKRQKKAPCKIRLF